MATWIVYKANYTDYDGETFSDVPQYVLSNVPKDKVPDLQTVKDYLTKVGADWMIRHIEGCLIVKTPDEIPENWQQKLKRWRASSGSWLFEPE